MQLPTGGAMIAIGATEAEVAEAIEGKEGELSIAAINGPTAIVVSGTEKAAMEVQAHCEEQGKKTKRLAVSHAFHSPLIEPMLEEFSEVAKSLDLPGAADPDRLQPERRAPDRRAGNRPRLLGRAT